MADGQRVGIAVACGAGMLGTFLPWASLGPMSVAGTAGDGWITLVLFAATLAVALVGNRKEAMASGARFAVIVLVMVSACVVLYDGSRLNDGSEHLVSIGPGIYLTVIGAVVAIVAACTKGHLAPTVFAILASAVIVASGFVSFPYGDHVPTTSLCGKPHWSLAGTFVDVDKLLAVGHRTADNTMVVDTMVKCGVISISSRSSD